MNDDLERSLVTKYPEIFVKVNQMGGIGCGDGWHTLIDTLCAHLMRRVYSDRMMLESAQKRQDPERTVVYTKHLAKSLSEVPEAVQVKEKFGGLRFYVDNGNDDSYSAIGLAESLSFKICETCGEPGRVRNRSWIKTLCDRHHLGVPSVIVTG